ncbi:hypothetical protein YC2023_088996 [Brassica napus]
MDLQVNVYSTSATCNGEPFGLDLLVGIRLVCEKRDHWDTSTSQNCFKVNFLKLLAPPLVLPQIQEISPLRPGHSG